MLSVFCVWIRMKSVVGPIVRDDTSFNPYGTGCGTFRQNPDLPSLAFPRQENLAL
jgi:hypothetical protein